MRLMCISENWYGNVYAPKVYPVIGEIYTVITIEPCRCGFCEKTMVFLEEMDHEIGWHIQHFAEVDTNICETKMERNLYQQNVK